ncbi:conserved hypothetical protein [Histoplasma capsulatum G186AR]|uniref:LYC1 C-terminal domain-containing protein n=2 Tax=Ajellomyces capsulatus TaxID=5037 RepID=C0NPC4_AJECG|nr:uncharacterized protein HCBG_05004 [Histoplasma capsulatum G186AR]EEH06784.1 conserved hypothetical protein [Histoplasma capsulatum G186AR]KAG5286910.1 putative acetyltransferase domain-containing protein [Histoplasma capsulatum]QSS75644.1 putative acetyltransferase domain-containing protein [Histoplasma capsulatum G186AR]
MGSSDCSMPLSDSADLTLVVPTPAERIECLKANSREWKGVLDADQYVQRENHLMNQDMTKDGAMTLWILVDRHLPPDNRPILSSCESFSKRAWLAHDGKVEQILAHGVGSVFSKPEFRRRGYAGRMISELAKRLDTWQQEDSVRKRGVFSVLYSDIGKSFYAERGWKAFPSSHISLPPVFKDKGKQSVSGVDLGMAGEMQADDVRRLMCSDAALEKYQQILREASHNSKRAKVAFVPDYAALSWHWAREEFYSKILFPGKGEPKVKGACVESRKVFICWNRNFGNTEKDNVLFILRTLYEEPRSPAEEKAVVEALAAALYCAQLEAHEWGRSRVDIWNPTPVVEKAVKMLSPTAQIEHREQTSICSLKWNGKQLGLGEDVDWYWNEKYAWC